MFLFFFASIVLLLRWIRGLDMDEIYISGRYTGRWMYGNFGCTIILLFNSSASWVMALIFTFIDFSLYSTFFDSTITLHVLYPLRH